MYSTCTLIYYVRQEDYVKTLRLFVCLFVCLCVCLCVCLLATLRKNYWPDIHENFTTYVSVDKKELSHPPPHPYPGIFRRIPQHYEIWRRFTMWLISPERLIGFSWKFCHRDILGQGSSCWILEVIRSPDTYTDSPWRTYAVSDCCCKMMWESWPRRLASPPCRPYCRRWDIPGWWRSRDQGQDWPRASLSTATTHRAEMNHL